MRPHRSVAQQRGGFFQNKLLYVAIRGRLPPLFVDLPLRLGRDRLIGRKRINGKETGGMSRQAVDRHHPDPVVDRVGGTAQRRSFEEPAAKRADMAQRPRAIESKQFRILVACLVPMDLVQSAGDLARRRRIEARPGQQDAQGVGVVSHRLAAHESALNGRCPSPHERVVYRLAWSRQTLDEEFGKLRFEAGAVAHLVNRMGLALAGRPEFIDQIGDGAVTNFARRLIMFVEISD